MKKASLVITFFWPQYSKSVHFVIIIFFYHLKLMVSLVNRKLAYLPETFFTVRAFIGFDIEMNERMLPEVLLTYK